MGQLQGYVVEAAVPRFVNKNGSPVPGRNWSQGDRMVDIDQNNVSYVLGADSIANRDRATPLNGIRATLETPALETLCISDMNELMDDFRLPGYSMCALSFSQKQYDESTNWDEETGLKMIKLYVNHPQQILSWVETCEVVQQRRCET